MTTVPHSGTNVNTNGPYAAAARRYLEAGWEPLPLPARRKSPPPPGFTGHNGKRAGAGDVERWIQGNGDGNIGLRMPLLRALSIDVDAYHGGLGTLRVLEEAYGPLPATWSSTSRDDGSRQQLYRLPGAFAVELPKSLGPGVDVIQAHHRYTVVWPSIHDVTGREYRWTRPDGTLAAPGEVPRVDELAPLPSAWLEARGLATGYANGHRAGEPFTIEVVDRIIEHGVAADAAQDDDLSQLVFNLAWRGRTDVEIRASWDKAVSLTTVRDAPGRPLGFGDADFERHLSGARAKLSDGPTAAQWEWARMTGGIASGGDGDGDADAETQARIHRDLVRIEKRTESVRRDARRELDDEALAAARGPRPKRTIAEYAELPRPAAVMDKVLAAEVNLLGGPSAAGKSLLARDWALAVASGADWRGYHVEEARACLYVASEGLHDVRERWTTQPLWRRASDALYILDQPVSLTSLADVDWLLDEYKDERPGLVVFDVVYAMGMAEDNGTKDVLPVIAALKRISAEWGAATLAIGHSGHNSGRRFRGSSMWRQLAATEWHMSDGALTCEKSKICDARTQTAAYRVDFPGMTWLDGGQVLGRMSSVREEITRDITTHPDDSDTARARRLVALFPDISARTMRRHVSDYTRRSDDA